MKGDYEEFDALKAAKNKANSSLSLQLRSGQALSNVEWSQFTRIAYCVLRIA